MARVVIVEAWYRGSHRAWADALHARSRHATALVTHPGVHWRWRMQGGAVTLAEEVHRAVADLGGIDALVVTSASNLPALLGLLRRDLGTAPTLLYLHENQLTFPDRSDHGRPASDRHSYEDRDLTYAMISWLSTVAADRVVFNSGFHRDDFFTALAPFLSGFPDLRHSRVAESVRAKSSVIAPGLDLARFSIPRGPEGPPTVVWNHRWEPDKRPDRFVAAMKRLVARRPEVVVDIIGSHVRPNLVDAAVDEICANLGHVGSIPDVEYPARLASADIVVSTAEHEFFGVAVGEAMAAGAHPIVPAALAYPELVPTELHERCLYDDDDGLDRLLLDAVDGRGTWPATRPVVHRHLCAFDLAHTVEELDALIDAAIDEGGVEIDLA